MTSYTYDRLETNGRLGNQLWQVAWVIGQAIKNNGIPCIRPDWDYRKYLSVPDEFFEPPSFPVVDGRDLFYQELHHWEHCVGLIFSVFQSSDLSRQLLSELYPAWLLDPNIHKTSIHIRAGDYLEWPTRFPVPSQKYYQTAISKAREQAPDTKFLVFSDDLGFARSWLGDEEFYYVEGTVRSADPTNRPGEPADQWDMFLQANCDLHIIANSTFSWWGAFLSESGQAFYPSVWFGPDVDAHDTLGRDVRESWVTGMPSYWEKIEC